MLASVKSLVVLLFCVLVTLNVVSAGCRELKRDDRFTEYCCSCTDKGWFGECLTTHSSACYENYKLNGDHSCPKGEWGCYTDYENPVN